MSVITGVVWLWVAALLLTGWIMVAAGSESLLVIGMMAATACASSAVAATLQIRCYMARMSGLIRASAAASTSDVYPLR